MSALPIRPLLGPLAPGLLMLGALVSCSEERDSLTGPAGGELASVISDAPRGGRVGFYFLPPMVPSPTTTGTATGVFIDQAKVDVCELGTTMPDAASSCAGKPIVASFTKTTGTAGNSLRYDATAGLYHVNWNTDLSVGGDIKSDRYYRVQVWLGGPVLVGYADLDPIKNGTEMKNPTTGTLIPLVSGRTLPIKFRLETGVATPLGEAGGNVTAAAGAVQLAFPEGALSSDVSIAVAPALPNAYPSDGSALAGTLYNFEPSPITFADPVELILTYPATLPQGARPDLFSLCRVAGTSCVPVPGSVVNTVSRSVTGYINGFSQYGITQLPIAGRFEVMPNADGQQLLTWPYVPATAVWGRTSSDAWAVGGAHISHFDGTTWQPHTVLPDGREAVGVWGSGPGNIYVTAGIRPDHQETPSVVGEIYRYNGSTLEVVFTTSEYPGKISGSAPDNVWVAATAGTAYHFNGSTWTTVVTGSQYDLKDIATRSPTDVYLGTCPFELLHFDGTSWESIDVPFAKACAEPASTFFVAPDGNLFIAQGDIHQFDGNSWATIPASPDWPVWDVVAWSPSNMYAITLGGGGTPLTLHYDGETWRELTWFGHARDYFGLDTGTLQEYARNGAQLVPGGAANEVFFIISAGLVLRSVP